MIRRVIIIDATPIGAAIRYIHIVFAAAPRRCLRARYYEMPRCYASPFFAVMPALFHTIYRFAVTLRFAFSVV